MAFTGHPRNSPRLDPGIPPSGLSTPDVEGTCSKATEEEDLQLAI